MCFVANPAAISAAGQQIRKLLLRHDPAGNDARELAKEIDAAR